MILTFIKAFLIGGGICMLGQVIINLTSLTNGKIIVLFLLIGAFLQAFGLYEPLVKFAGAGATVPISGFGYALVKGAVEMSQEEGFFGAIAGALSATAVGISVAIISGYIVALISKPRTKTR